MFLFNRLYRRRYTERYLSIIDGVKDIEHMLSLELKNKTKEEIGYWWVRRAILSTVYIDYANNACRVDARAATSGPYVEYRIAVTHKVDAPLWGGLKFRSKIKVCVNELFDQFGRFEDRKVRMVKLGDYVTEYLVEGKIKLP